MPLPCTEGNGARLCELLHFLYPFIPEGTLGTVGGGSISHLPFWVCGQSNN